MKRVGDLRALHALRQLGRHPWVHLDGCDMLRFFEDADRQVSSARTNFEHPIRWPKIGLE